MLVEDKCIECAHFSFNTCLIYTHDGASAKYSTNSHETDNSAVPIQVLLFFYLSSPALLLCPISSLSSLLLHPSHDPTPQPHQLVVYYSAPVPARFLLLSSRTYQTPAPLLKYLPDSCSSAPVPTRFLLLCSDTYQIPAPLLQYLPDSCSSDPVPTRPLLHCFSTYQSPVPTRVLLLCSCTHQIPAPLLQNLPDPGSSAPVPTRFLTSAPVLNRALLLCSCTYQTQAHLLRYLPNPCSSAPVRTRVLLLCSSS